MINTVHKKMTYLEREYDIYRTSFRRKSLDKAITEATGWMKEHSKTFLQFELVDEYEANYMSMHRSGSRVNLNNQCTISQTDSDNFWVIDLYLRV